MSQAERAFTLHVGGLTWREVGDEMGLSRTAAKNAGHYWRKRHARNAQARDKYANDPAYRAKKVDQCAGYSASDTGKATRSAYRKANRGRLNHLGRQSYHRHAERTNAERRDRYASDPEHRAQLLAAGKRYQEENPEKVSEASRLYNIKNRVRLAEYRKQWRANGGAEWERQYKAARRDHNRTVFKRWLARNRQAVRASRARYHFANRSERLLARSIWQYGPDWGPVHRALNDLRAKTRSR